MHKKYYIVIFVALATKETISLAALTGATCPTPKNAARPLLAATTRWAMRFINAHGESREKQKEIASTLIANNPGKDKVAVEKCLQQADKKSRGAEINITIYCEDVEQSSLIKSFISSAQVQSGFRLNINSIKIETLNIKTAHISVNQVKRRKFELEQEKKPVEKKGSIYSQYKARL